MWLFKGLWVRFRLWLLVAVGLGRLGCWLGWDPLGLVFWRWMVGRLASGCLIWSLMVCPLWFRVA